MLNVGCVCVCVCVTGVGNGWFVFNIGHVYYRCGNLQVCVS